MRRARARWRHRRDEGYTLIELTVALSLTGILLAIVLVVVTTFMHVQNNTNLTYSELNQLTPVGTNFQNLLRTAVSPATNGTGNAPVPPFGLYTTTSHAIASTTLITGTSLTFFANASTPNGPVEIKASLQGTAKKGYQFVVREFFVTTTTSTAATVTSETPTTPTTSVVHRCPGLTTLTTITPTTGLPISRTPPESYRCKWKTTRLPLCPSTNKTCHESRQVLAVDDVVNPELTPPKPIFTYYLAAPMNGPLSPSNHRYTTPAHLAAEPFASCTPPTPPASPGDTPITNCPADNIESIKIDLEVATPGVNRKVTLKKQKIESQTVTYQLSTVSQTYSPQVG